MADGDFRDAAVQGRAIRTTDLLFAADPDETDLEAAARSDTLAQLIATIFANPPAGHAAFTTALAAKLNAIEANAKDDQTSSEIVDLIDIALGGTAWQNTRPGTGRDGEDGTLWHFGTVAPTASVPSAGVKTEDYYYDSAARRIYRVQSQAQARTQIGTSDSDRIIFTVDDRNYRGPVANGIRLEIDVGGSADNLAWDSTNRRITATFASATPTYADIRNLVQDDDYGGPYLSVTFGSTTPTSTQLSADTSLVLNGGANTWQDLGEIRGHQGWAPVLASEVDGERRLLKLTSYTGGAGNAPQVPTDAYIGAAGLVAKANAQDFRGAAGEDGSDGADGRDGVVPESADLVEHGAVATIEITRASRWYRSAHDLDDLPNVFYLSLKLDTQAADADDTPLGIYLIRKADLTGLTAQTVVQTADVSNIAGNARFLANFPNQDGDNVELFLARDANNILLFGAGREYPGSLLYQVYTGQTATDAAAAYTPEVNAALLHLSRITHDLIIDESTVAWANTTTTGAGIVDVAPSQITRTTTAAQAHALFEAGTARVVAPIPSAAREYITRIPAASDVSHFRLLYSYAYNPARPQLHYYALTSQTHIGTHGGYDYYHVYTGAGYPAGSTKTLQERSSVNTIYEGQISDAIGREFDLNYYVSNQVQGEGTKTNAASKRMRYGYPTPIRFPATPVNRYFVLFVPTGARPVSVISEGGQNVDVWRAQTPKTGGRNYTLGPRKNNVRRTPETFLVTIERDA